MNDAEIVGIRDRLACLDHEIDGFFDGEWAMLLEARAQIGAFEEFHDDEMVPILLPNLVNGANIGMVQGRGRASLALKTF